MHLASKSKAIIIIINLNNSGQSGLNLDQTIHLNCTSIPFLIEKELFNTTSDWVYLGDNLLWFHLLLRFYLVNDFKDFENSQNTFIPFQNTIVIPYT